MLKLPLSPLLSDSAASTWERAADKWALGLCSRFDV